MIELTLAKAKALLVEAVAERGEDYVYVNPSGIMAPTNCYYVHGDQPGCIVGWVLHKAGMSLDDLTDYEAQAAGELVEGLVSDGPDREGITTLLNAAQQHQDNGETWGFAVREALKESAE